MVTIPGAGHFVQRDAAEEVSLALTHWLSLPPLKSRPDGASPAGREHAEGDVVHGGCLRW